MHKLANNFNAGERQVTHDVYVCRCNSEKSGVVVGLFFLKYLNNAILRAEATKLHLQPGAWLVVGGRGTESELIVLWKSSLFFFLTLINPHKRGYSNHFLCLHVCL